MHEHHYLPIIFLQMWRLTQTKTISIAKNTSSTPASNNDKLLDQQATSAGNVAVGVEQASMDEAMIEGCRPRKSQNEVI